MSKKKVKKSSSSIIIPAIIGGLILWFLINSYNNNSIQSKQDIKMKRFNEGDKILKNLMNKKKKNE